MSTNVLERQLAKLLAEADTIINLADSEDRATTASEAERIGELATEARAKRQKMDADAALRAEIVEMGAGLDLDGKTPGKGMPAPSIRGKTLGQQFVEAEKYIKWLAEVAPSGHVPDSMKVQSPAIQFERLIGRKTLITGDSSTSAGAFVETDYTRIIEMLGRQELTVRDLISGRLTGSDLVHFIRQTAKVTQAEVVPEANVTDYTGATGEISGEKPEGAMAFEEVTEPVKTIAVWIPATKQALSDAAQIRSMIDEELRADLEEELEDQMINGTGVGNDFTGILATSGILSQAWNTDLLVTARKAITTARVTGRVRPTAWLLNPEDWETIDLLTDSDGRYFFGGPTRMGIKSLWGLTVVESETVPQGTGLLADWKKAALWDRELASIQISEHHADFFIRNMVAILAEMRAAFGVIRPSGFVEVDLESGS